MYDQVTNTCYLLIFNNQTGVLCTGSPVFLEGIRHFVFFNLTVLVLFCMEYIQNSQYLCTFLHEVHLKFSVHVYCHFNLMLSNFIRCLSFTTLCNGTIERYPLDVSCFSVVDHSGCRSQNRYKQISVLAHLILVPRWGVQIDEKLRCILGNIGRVIIHMYILKVIFGVSCVLLI